MKSSDPEQELERLFSAARRAPLEAISPEMPFGLATRVLAKANQKREDWFAEAMPIVRWALAGSLAVVLLAAIFNFSSPSGSPSGMEFAVRHQFTNLVLKQ